MELEVGVLFGGRIEVRPEWPIFPVWAPLFAVFVADLVVKALGKPYNRPFCLHGSLSPWLWKALASKVPLSPPMPVWAWLHMLNGSPKVKSHPVQFLALVSVSLICFDIKSQEWIFWAEFLVSVL